MTAEPSRVTGAADRLLVDDEACCKRRAQFPTGVETGTDRLPDGLHRRGDCLPAEAPNDALDRGDSSGGVVVAVDTESPRTLLCCYQSGVMAGSVAPAMACSSIACSVGAGA